MDAVTHTCKVETAGFALASDIASLFCLGQASQGNSLTLSLSICEWEVMVKTPSLQNCGEDDAR